jgi:hypothetical protein
MFMAPWLCSWVVFSRHPPAYWLPQVDAKVWGVDAGAVPGLVGPAAGALGLAAQGGEVYMEPGCVRVTMHLLMSHK